MALQDNPRRKNPNLDPKFNVEVRPSRKKPGTGKKELLPKKIGTPSKRELMPLKGKEAIDAYQRSIRPENIAKENFAAKKALEKKYPGMFLPEVRDTAGIHRSK